MIGSLVMGRSAPIGAEVWLSSGSYAHGASLFLLSPCRLDENVKTLRKRKKIFSPNFIIAKVVADEEH